MRVLVRSFPAGGLDWGFAVTIPRLKDRFRPRAESSLLSEYVKNAWQEKQAVAEPIIAEVAERLARYFDEAIPPEDLAVLDRYKCVARHDACNVRVYDPNPNDVAHYRESFGVQLPRKVPTVGTGGFGYPSLVMCDPAKPILPELEPHFRDLLALRKSYYAEYKQSTAFPKEYHEENGVWPTWGEIEERFPVLAAYIARLRQEAKL